MARRKSIAFTTLTAATSASTRNCACSGRRSNECPNEETAVDRAGGCRGLRRVEVFGEGATDCSAESGSPQVPQRESAEGHGQGAVADAVAAPRREARTRG